MPPGRANGVGWNERRNYQNTLHQHGVNVLSFAGFRKVDIPAAPRIEIHWIAAGRTRTAAVAQRLLHQCRAGIRQCSSRIVIFDGVITLRLRRGQITRFQIFARFPQI